MQKNESADNRVFNNQKLFDNLTKVNFSNPFKWNEYVIYRTTKDYKLKKMIDYKLSYISVKDKSGNFSVMLEDFRQRFDRDLPTKGLDDDEV